MKLFIALAAFAAVAVSGQVVDLQPGQFALFTHAAVADSDSMADSLLGAMDGAAAAIAQADDKLQAAVDQAKTKVKALRAQGKEKAAATVEAQLASVENKAAAAQPASPGGFDWSKYAPPMGGATSKKASAPAPGGFDWSKYAPSAGGATSKVATSSGTGAGPQGAAAGAGTGAGGFDWSKYVPKGAGAGPATATKTPTVSHTSEVSPPASPTASSGPGYDWSRFAPKDTTGGSFNTAPAFLEDDGSAMPPKKVADTAGSMSDSVAAAADALADKLKAAAAELRLASEKLSAKADAVDKALYSDSDDASLTDTSDVLSTTNLRSDNTSSSWTPTMLSVFLVGSVLVAGLLFVKSKRSGYERV